MKKTTNFDAFAQFADAQLSKEEMKNIKGGGDDTIRYTCTYGKEKLRQSIEGTEASFSFCEGRSNCSCQGVAGQFA